MQSRDNLSARPGQKSDKDESSAYHTERLDLRTNETLVRQTLFPESRLHPAVTLQHGGDQERTPRSDEPTPRQTVGNRDRKSSDADKNKEPRIQRRRPSANTSDHGVMELLEYNRNLPPKQYTEFWYCHLNCMDPGPWRSQSPRCIGCEHSRCDLCQKEVVVTRDPSPPGL